MFEIQYRSNVRQGFGGTPPLDGQSFGVPSPKFWCRKVTVWCAFSANGIIGPYFFENEAGNSVTVTGERYRAMITNFLWPELNGMDVEDVWFQQDGATCHSANATMALLNKKFTGRIISRNSEIN